MKKSLTLLLSAALSGSAFAAPVPIGPGSLVYSQNFNALAVDINNNPAITTWADDATIPGWWLYRAGNTAGAPIGLAGAFETYYVADGNAAPNTAPLAHGFYSNGLASAPDRSLGFCPTTAQGELSAILILQNTSATPLKLNRVKFAAEAYRSNTTANVRDSIFVWYKTGASPDDLLQDNTIAPAAGNTTDFIVGTNTTGPTSYYITGWTNLREFTYTQTTPTAGIPLPPDTQAFDSAPTSATIQVQPGQFLGIRWSNLNDGGVDAIQGIDDLELTFVSSSGCVVDANVSAVTRLPGANPNIATDDSVQFTINASAVNGSAGGWKVPAGGLAGGTTGAYSTPKVVTAALADFGATGTATLRVEDSAEPGCFKTVDVTVPPFIQKVTATASSVITFTPAAIGSAAYIPPAADQSELGWTGGSAGANTASNVQKQPDSGAFIGTNQYWHLTTANATFTTDPVDVSALAGVGLEAKFDLAFYSTSTTELDDNDVLNARVEVAVDGNFSNFTPGNIITQVYFDIFGAGAPQAFSQSIPAASPYIDLNNAGFPAADFILYPFTKVVGIPVGATSARARIIVASGAGVSNSEHIILDNVRFSKASIPGDTDADGMPDSYETANGLNPNSNADRDTDLDHDGASNFSEYTYGTQANNNASVFKITAASISAAGEVSVTWSSVVGKNYQAQISTDLGGADPWLSVGAPITATGTSTSLPAGIIIPNVNPRYFLRIIISP
jgi:hypothetical protein